MPAITRMSGVSWRSRRRWLARLHALWRIDPVRHDRGIWTAVSREKRLPHGMGAALPAMRAERATRERLKEGASRAVLLRFGVSRKRNAC